MRTQTAVEVCAILGGLVLAATLALARIPYEQRALASVDRIWDRAAHNAFTSLVKAHGALYCAFREAGGHVSALNGSIRVIRSADGENWQSVAHLFVKGVDLRDPKLSVTPDGRLMLLMGGSIYHGHKYVGMHPWVSFSDSLGLHFGQPERVVLDPRLNTGSDWLWRVTWHEGLAYGVVYQRQDTLFCTHLVRSTDGLHYDWLTPLEVPGDPNETSLAFRGDEMLAVVRRDRPGANSAFLGRSLPPYRDWLWTDLGERVGGPQLVVLPEGLLLGGRLYNPARTVLIKVTEEGGFYPLLVLPSGGDCSYPGLLVDGDQLLVSYYSSHEGRTSIYLARVWLDELRDLLVREPTPAPVVSRDENGSVELACRSRDAQIRYTVDGSDPDSTSPVYSGTFYVEGPTRLKMVATRPEKRPSAIVTAWVGRDVVQQPVTLPTPPKAGLRYWYYQGKIRRIEDIAKMAAVDSGVVASVDLGPATRDDHFALILEGLVKAPTDGRYIFTLRSDDGSRLELDGFLLVDNGGFHDVRERSNYAVLKAGWHRVRVWYFQGTGGQELRLLWRGPGFSKREVLPEVLGHVEWTSAP